jgi:periplasmic copper chaperone A
MIFERENIARSETNMKTTNRRAALVAAALLAATANAAFAAPVTVTEAWMRALPGNLPAGGYFTLHNGTAKSVTLTSAQSSACGMLMLHKSDTMSGMASMSDVASVDVAAGSTVKFAPGGYHLMCMDPTPALKPGASVAVTLQLAGGAKITTPFAVRNATGK